MTNTTARLSPIKRKFCAFLADIVPTRHTPNKSTIAKFFQSFIVKGHWKSLALAALAMLLAALNLLRLGGESFWSDEVFSINLARMDIWGLLAASSMDNHPPLYYMILFGFRQLFGESGVVLHLTSVVPVLLGLCFGTTKVRTVLGYKAACLYLALSTLTSAAFKHSVEVRMYSWACLFVTLNYWYGFEILTAPKNRAGSSLC